MICASSPLYDINKTFAENFHHSSFSLIAPPPRNWPSQTQYLDFLGFPLASRIGAAPCAVTTGKGIALLASLGFDVLTYKTIRRRAHPSHPLPNIVYLDKDSLLTAADLAKPIYTQDHPATHLEKIAISNSFGNACVEPEMLMQDIGLAKSALSKGQVLIVSIYGEGVSEAAMAKDFLATALLAKQAGADIIELNLSCPNLLKEAEPIYWDAALVYKLSAHVVSGVGDVPVCVKLGLLPASFSLNETLQAMARAGVRGVSAINAISMRVLDPAQQPALGKRLFSGVSGYPIRALALQFIRNINQINQEKRLNLVILGMGGITLPEHFAEFFTAGADIALSATGMMWNPYLAWQYHQHMQSPS
jgi:dihydroorotate dehydrogenase